MKEVKKENTPPCQIPYRDIHHPYLFQFVVPGNGIEIFEDANGVLYLSAKGGSLDDLVAGDNIEINRTEDGKVVVSSVNTATDIAAGQNITIDIDPDTGTAIINSIIGGPTNEHYKGVFDTPDELIAANPDPETGDYGMVKNIVITNGESSWNGQYKYCFYINGQWTVVDQMLTFTKNLDLLQQYYSVGGSSPVIYLHEIARSGNFWDLNNVPIVATPEVTVEGTTVTASCATEGAEIWYTTDGSMPHVNGTRYTGPVTASGATTFRFVGIKNGMINSLEAVVGADFSLDAPEIEYNYHTAEVTLTNPNVDGNNDPVGAIYYTIDGTEPSSASSLYTGPFNIQTTNDTKGRTVKAVVYDSGSDVYSEIVSQYFMKRLTSGQSSSNAESGVNSQYWFVSQGTGSDPFAPAADGECYYTTDGSNPDYNSTPLTSALSFMRYGGPVALKVIGYRPGWLPSAIRTITVSLDKPTAPTISFDADSNAVTLGATGNVTAYPPIPMKITADNPNNGYRIYYTLDGSTPTALSTIYTGPFQISGNTTVKAVIVAYGQYSSDVATENIVITAVPSISMNYLNGEITIEGPAGASVYYTLDGSDPTSESTQYTGPIEDVVPLLRREIKAIAVVGSQASEIVSAVYNRVVTGLPAYEIATDLNIGKCLVGPYIPASAFSVFYSVTAPGFDVRTLDYEPAESAVEIPYYDAGNPQIVVVKTVRPEYLPTYSYTDPLGYTAPTAPEITYDDGTNLVTIELDGNTAYIPLQTNNNVPTMGARIYYTTDGSTPTTSSTLYTRPFNLPEGATEIKAMTVCYGEFESEVTDLKFAPMFYFEALEAGSTVSAKCNSAKAGLEYSYDGVIWHEWQHGTIDPMFGGNYDVLTLNNIGDKVYIRATAGNYQYSTSAQYFRWSFTGQLHMGGDMTALVGGESVAYQMPCCYQTLGAACLKSVDEDILLGFDELRASCFNGLLSGSDIVIAPKLPQVFEIAENCFRSMLSNTNITESPMIPWPELPTKSCAYMFNGCGSLAKITCLSADVSASDCTLNWTAGVASSGVFVLPIGMTDWQNGDSGIPSGWTTEYWDETES